MQKMIILICGVITALVSIWLYYIDKSYTHFEIPIYELEEEIGDINNAEFLIVRYPNQINGRTIVTAIYKNRVIKNFKGMGDWDTYLPMNTPIETFKLKEIIRGEKWKLKQSEFYYIKSNIDKITQNVPKEKFFHDSSCVVFYYNNKCYWYLEGSYDGMTEFEMYLNDAFGDGWFFSDIDWD